MHAALKDLVFGHRAQAQLILDVLLSPATEWEVGDAQLLTMLFALGWRVLEKYRFSTYVVKI